MSPLSDPAIVARQRAMGVLARANMRQLAEYLSGLACIPAHHDVRHPEIGLVMVRGQIAGSGAPFNLGETSVTRAAVALDTGEVGFSYILGRDAAKARAAALVDALWQRGDWRAVIEAGIIEPLAKASAAADARLAAETAPTRVDFFTLVRGEDA